MRNYNRKTDRVTTANNVMVSVEAAVRNGRSIRDATAEFGINFMKLHHFCKKSAGLTVVPRQEHTYQTFTKCQEDAHVNYLKTATKMYHSLSIATSFNRTNVANFFKNLAQVRDRYQFQAHKNFNLDETGIIK